MAVLTNTMMQGTAAASDDGDEQFVIKRSLRFNNPDSPYITRTPYLEGNRRTFTIAAWVRRNRSHDGVFEVFTVAQGGTSDPRDEMILWHLDRVKTSQNISSGSWQECKVDNTPYRDSAAWYHIMVAYDTPQAVAADRVKMYVNGKLQTFSYAAYPTQDQDLTVMNTWQHTWGRYEAGDGNHFDGAMTGLYLIDGKALTPASFGKFDASGVFNPIDFKEPTPNDGSTWSNMVTSGDGDFRNHGGVLRGPLRLFDGDITTACQDDSNSAGNNITFTPTTPIPYNCSVEVYCYGTPKHEYHWENEDGTKGTNHGDTESWHEVIVGSGKLKSLKVVCQNAAYMEPSAIRVDGVVLKDGAVDGYRRISPMDGTSWSGQLSASGGFDGSYPESHAFDGLVTSAWRVQTASTDTPIVWDTNIKVNKSISIWSGKSTWKYQINDSGSYTTVTGHVEKWKDIAFEGQLTNLKIMHAASGEDAGFSAIKIDGYLMVNERVDNGCCLNFEDGRETRYLGKDTLHGRIEDATGGLPMYNTTTDAYNSVDCGDVKGAGYRADSNKANLVFALPGDTIADVSNNAALRNSGSAKTITNSNAAVTTDQSRFYGSSISLGAYNENKHLYVTPANGGTDFDFGTSSFCFECWARSSSTSNNSGNTSPIFETSYDDTGLTGWIMLGYYQANLHFWWSNAAGDAIQSANLGSNFHNKDVNQWIHYAVTHDSSTNKLRVFRNGVILLTKSSGEFKADWTSGSGLYIGRQNFSGDADRYWGGEVSDFKVYKGAPVYTKPFAPPWRQDWTVNNIQSENTGAPNDGTTWSDYLTSSTGSWNSGNVGSYMFNGSLGNYAQPSATNAHVTFTPPTAMTYSKIEVYQTAGDGFKTRLNSTGSWTEFDASEVGANEWTTVHTADPPASFTSFQYGTDGGVGGNWLYIAAMRVDGVKLVDGEGVKPHQIDVSTDSPSNSGEDTGLGGEVSGNFAGFGDKTKHADITIKNNRREAHGPTAGSTRNARIEWPMTSGKWYWEIESTRTGTNNGGQQIGICTDDYDTRSTSYPGQTAYTWAINGNDGDLHHNGSVVVTDYCLVGGTSNGEVMTTGNICMCAYDADAGKFWMGMNGTWGNNSGTGNPATGANPGVSSGLAGKQIFPITSTGTDSGANHVTLNPGDRKFAYQAPSGFKALCTQNLPDTFTESNVNNPSKFFDIVRWKGYGNNADRTISGTQFQPDLIWAKGEDTTYYHQIYDAAYGFGNDHSWASNANTGRGYGQGGTYGWYESNSKGITLRQGSGTDLYVDESGKAYIAWLWDCGAAAATASTAGDVTPSAQWVNNEAGFSITNWAGNDTNPYTVGHGLSVKPNFIIIKRYSTGSSSNFIYHSSLGAEKYMQFDATGSVGDDAGFMNDTEPDNEKFTLGNWNGWDAGENIFAYCFANIPGYFKAGSYEGNATSNANGPIFDLGFRPRMIIFKNSATSNGWRMMDTHANGDTSLGQAGAPQGNGVIQGMYPHLTNGYDSPSNWNTDYLCNGVNVRASDAEMNGDGNEVIYMAWAEHPFKTARAR